MKILHKILVGLQVLLVVLGFIMMISNIVATSKLSLPAQAYEERVYLSHILNAVQAFILFGAAVALNTLLSKIKKDDYKD